MKGYIGITILGILLLAGIAFSRSLWSSTGYGGGTHSCWGMGGSGYYWHMQGEKAEELLPEFQKHRLEMLSLREEISSLEAKLGILLNDPGANKSEIKRVKNQILYFRKKCLKRESNLEK